MTDNTAKAIIRQSIPILVLALFISIGSGTIISAQEDTLLALPLLGLLLPAFINMGGDSAGILGARLGTALHVGTIKANEWNKDLLENLFSTMFVSIIAFTFLGIVSYGISYVLGYGMSFVQVVSITMLGGIITSVIMNLLAVSAAFISYSRGLDPDNIVTPIMSTGGDIVGVIALFLSLRIVMGL